MNDTEAHSPALGVAATSSTARSTSSGDAAEVGRVGERQSRRLSVGPKSIAAAIALLSVLLPVGWSGLWAPHELTMADFSRRIAVGLHGAEALAVPGADNSVPTLTELGKGQL